MDWKNFFFFSWLVADSENDRLRRENEALRRQLEDYQREQE